jgi:hypothetical protein
MTDVFFAPGPWKVFSVATSWASTHTEAKAPWPDAVRFMSTIFAGPLQSAKKAGFSAWRRGGFERSRTRFAPGIRNALAVAVGMGYFASP